MKTTKATSVESKGTGNFSKKNNFYNNKNIENILKKLDKIESNMLDALR